jgi:hypothetical protein
MKEMTTVKPEMLNEFTRQLSLIQLDKAEDGKINHVEEDKINHVDALADKEGINMLSFGFNIGNIMVLFQNIQAIAMGHLKVNSYDMFINFNGNEHISFALRGTYEKAHALYTMISTGDRNYNKTFKPYYDIFMNDTVEINIKDICYVVFYSECNKISVKVNTKKGYFDVSFSGDKQDYNDFVRHIKEPFDR